MALTVAGVPFENNIVSLEEFFKAQETYPLGCLPTMELSFPDCSDPITMVQSHAMLLYVGKLFNLYPTDPLLAFYVDQVIHTASELFEQLVGSGGFEPDEKKKAREKTIDAGGKRFFGGCEKLITKIPGSDKGSFVLGEEISIADLYITMVYNLIMSGYLQFVKKDALQEYKRMFAIRQAVMKRTEVKAYYEKNPFTNLPFTR